MAYVLFLKPRVRKDLNNFNDVDRLKIKLVLDVIARDPFSGKKLEGDMKDYYSVRVWPNRIVYEIYKKERIIMVVRIGHRQGVYK